MKITQADIRGMLGIVPTPATPDAESWRTEHSVNLVETEKMVKLVVASGIEMLATTGTFGECATLTEAELNDFVACVVETNAKQVPVFAGITTLNTRDTIRRGRKLVALGADGLFIGRPMWLALNDQGIVRFYRDIAEALPGVPLIVYDNPVAFKGKISSAAYAELATIPEVVAAKHTGGPALEADMRAIGDRIRILPLAAEWMPVAETLPDLALAAWSGAVACAPAAIDALSKAVLARDWGRARHAHERVAWADAAMFAGGDLGGFMDNSIGIAHLRFQHAGLIDPGPARPPYLHLPEKYHLGGIECGKRWAVLQKGVLEVKLPLTIACWDYDRTRTLFDGRTPIEGVDANILNLPVEETFFRALRSQEFDVAELSLSSYTLMRSRGNAPYTAIPVFLSRMFRHEAIYIRTDRGIREPKDLIGRTIGVPEYQLTAPVWVRGILQHEYGVKPADLQWRTGGIETPGRHEKVPLDVPGVAIEPIPAGETLNQWLLDGKIDALVSPRAPSAFSERRPNIGRLFGDLRGAERAYHAKTGLYPIMHLVGIRNSLVERHPWLAASLMKAFTQAKDHALAELHDVAALKVSLPWLAAEMDDTVRLLGRDFWSYGLKGNEKTLDAFLGYHHEQGLSAMRLKPSDLFVPSATEQFVI